MRRCHIGALRRRGVVSCEGIGVDHLAVGEIGGDSGIGVVGRQGVPGLRGVQRQGGVVLPRHLDAVGRARQGDVDCLSIEADPLDRRKVAVPLVFHLPVPAAVVGYAHRVIAPSEKRLPDILITRRGAAQEIAPDGDGARPVGKMEVVVGQSETVVPGTEGPVPVLVLLALAAVEFHDPVAAEFPHVVLRRADRPQGMVHLDEVGLLAQQVQLELFLRGKERDEVVEEVHVAAPEHQFVVFEQVVAVLVDIDLQQRVVRMHGQLIVVREGHDVVAEFAVGRIGFVGPVCAFVQDALHPGVGMEVGPFPAERRISAVPIGVEDVRSAERPRFGKIVDGAHAGDEDRQKGDQDQCCQGLEHDDRYLPEQGGRGPPAGTQFFLHKQPILRIDAAKIRKMSKERNSHADITGTRLGRSGPHLSLGGLRSEAYGPVPRTAGRNRMAPNLHSFFQGSGQTAVEKRWFFLQI